MQLFKPEKFPFKEEEFLSKEKDSHKRKDFCEKFQESQTEQVERDEGSKNKVEIHYTGYRKNFEFPLEKRFIGGKLLEVDKIEIINEKGEKFNFSSLLPENWTFCRMAERCYGFPFSEPCLYCDPTSKEIQFPHYSYHKPNTLQWLKTFSQPMDLLDLLHEIGHSFKPKKSYIKAMRIGRLIKKTNFYSSEKEKQDYYQYIILSERNAWAYALRKYRELKRQGINIAPEEISNQEILEHIRHYLSTYLSSIAFGGSVKDRKVIKIKRKVAQKIKKPKPRWKKFKDKIITEIISKLPRLK